MDIGACITLLFLERRNPQVVAGWLLLILFLPIGGFVVYLFFGRHLYIFSKKTAADEGIGVFNIGDDYLGKGPLGYWHDTHLRLHDGAVAGLQTRFIVDWNYAVPDSPVKVSENSPYYPMEALNFPYGPSSMQIASSDQDSSGRM